MISIVDFLIRIGIYYFNFILFWNYFNLDNFLLVFNVLKKLFFLKYVVCYEYVMKKVIIVIVYVDVGSIWSCGLNILINFFVIVFLLKIILIFFCYEL